MNSRVRKTFAVLLLTAATSGCASFHKKPLTVAPPPPDAPELSQSPLYSPAMGDSSPRTPALPEPVTVAVVKPPPPVQKPHRIKKTKKAADSTATAAGASVSPSSATSMADSSPTTPSSVERKPGLTQASISPADGASASPIGDLTTGSAADAAETSHHTDDLIRTTREGVQGIKRSLSSDEKKTVAEIWAFLDRAQQALKNGDVDGAYGLATKAKLLLDELTQK